MFPAQYALTNPNEHKVIIDIRSQKEFKDGAAPGSLLIPLETFRDNIVQCLQFVPQGSDLILMCKSGMRASYAYGIVQALGLNNDYNWSVYEGGIIRWKEQGLPVIQSSTAVELVHTPVFLGGAKRIWSLPSHMRVVQGLAGFVVLLSSLLVIRHIQGAIWCSALTGAALLFSGLTGYCALGRFLNQRKEKCL